MSNETENEKPEEMQINHEQHLSYKDVLLYLRIMEDTVAMYEIFMKGEGTIKEHLLTLLKLQGAWQLRDQYEEMLKKVKEQQKEEQEDVKPD